MKASHASRIPESSFWAYERKAKAPRRIRTKAFPFSAWKEDEISMKNDDGSMH